MAGTTVLPAWEMSQPFTRQLDWQRYARRRTAAGLALDVGVSGMLELVVEAHVVHSLEDVVLGSVGEHFAAAAPADERNRQLAGLVTHRGVSRAELAGLFLRVDWLRRDQTRPHSVGIPSDVLSDCEKQLHRLALTNRVERAPRFDGGLPVRIHEVVGVGQVGLYGVSTRPVADPAQEHASVCRPPVGLQPAHEDLDNLSDHVWILDTLEGSTIDLLAEGQLDPCTSARLGVALAEHLTFKPSVERLPVHTGSTGCPCNEVGVVLEGTASEVHARAVKNGLDELIERRWAGCGVGRIDRLVHSCIVRYEGAVELLSESADLSGQGGDVLSGVRDEVLIGAPLFLIDCGVPRQVHVRPAVVVSACHQEAVSGEVVAALNH